MRRIIAAVLAALFVLSIPAEAGLDSKKASTAKKVILRSWNSDEDASIKAANLKSGEIVYAYAVHKQDSAHVQKSTDEACAKHLKDEAIAAK